MKYETIVTTASGDQVFKMKSPVQQTKINHCYHYVKKKQTPVFDKRCAK